MSTPSAVASSMSRASSRGYASRSSPGPNWAGLTKSETTTTSHCSRARRISERWPPWKAPMVGTRPILRPARRSGASDRARQRPLGAELGDALDRAAHERREQGAGLVRGKTGAGGDPLRGSEQRDGEVGGDGRRRVIGGAALVVDLEGGHAEQRGESDGEVERRGGGAGDGAARSGEGPERGRRSPGGSRFGRPSLGGCRFL